MNPTGTIYICRNTNMKYQSPDTILFASNAEKQAYFASKVINPHGVFSNQMYTRSTTNGVSSTLNGKLYVSPGTSAVKLNCRIQDILNADYMYYIEPSYGNKYFYNFITDVSYISDEVTQVTFAEDVFMTWCNDIEIKPSYVVRETSSSDARFSDEHDQRDYQLGEQHAFVSGDFYASVTKPKYLCLVLNVPARPTINDAGMHWDGFYLSYKAKSKYGLNMGRGDNLYYYICDTSILSSSEYLSYFFSKLIEDAETGAGMIPSYKVLHAFMLPECAFSSAIETFFLNNPSGFAVVCPDANAFMHGYGSAAQLYITCQAFNYLSSATVRETAIPAAKFTENMFEGYIPNNNKLYSSPYVTIRVKNNWGDAVDLEPQHFLQHGGSFLFRMKTTMGNVCKINMYPFGYENSATSDNTSYRVSLPPFPTLPITVDHFNQWLSQNLLSNALRVGIGVAGGTLSAGIGASLMAANAGADTIAGTGRFLHGLTEVESGAKEVTSSLGGVIAEGDSIRSKGISTIGQDTDGFAQCSEGSLTFTYEILSVDKASARSIDDYFTMFGYAVNHIKAIPFNLNGRTRFHYVQTSGCNVTGNAPMYAKNYIADRYDKGIRLWKKEVFLDYSEFNSIA